MRVLTLTKNYRSTPEIIECALAVIEKGGKTRLLEPQVKSGCKVRLVKANSDLQEGIFIAKEINRMIGGIDMLDVHDDRFTTEDKGIRNFSDIGILYRTHRQAKLIESCLAKEGIPYMVSVGDDILEEEEIKKIICFLRFLADPWDKTLLKEYLTLVWKYPDVITNSILDCWKIETKWSLKDIEENRSNLNEVCPDQEFIDQILRYLPLVNKGKPNKVIEKWMEEYNLLQSKEFDQFIHISVFYKNVKEFIEVLLLGQEDLIRSSSMKYDADAVKLMTFHAAKGLEFPVVFLCGVNKGCIPLENKGQKNDIEEERRLFYVAVTRAEQELILVQSKEPSPFLSDLPLDMLKHELASGHKEKRIEKQLSIFDYL